jgi:hypothetical protein
MIRLKMRPTLSSWLVTALCLVVCTAHAAPSAPSIEAFQGRLFNDADGSFEVEDVFSRDYMPINRLAVPLLVTVAVDLGPDCKHVTLSGKAASDVLQGKVPAPRRPTSCEKPTATLQVLLKYSDGSTDQKRLPLAQFMAGSDGKVRVPLLFYRRLTCSPLTVTAKLVGSAAQVTQTVAFDCQE